MSHFFSLTFSSRHDLLMIEFSVDIERLSFLNFLTNLPSQSVLKLLTPGANLKSLGLKNSPTYLHRLPRSLYSWTESLYRV